MTFPTDRQVRITGLLCFALYLLAQLLACLFIDYVLVKQSPAHVFVHTMFRRKKASNLKLNLRFNLNKFKLKVIALTECKQCCCRFDSE